MGHESIELEGTEITIIKALGLYSPGCDGATLRKNCAPLLFSVLMETLKRLMTEGYIEASWDHFNNEETFDKVHFNVNARWEKELAAAMEDPDGPPVRKPQRSRRE